MALLGCTTEPDGDSSTTTALEQCEFMRTMGYVAGDCDDDATTRRTSDDLGVQVNNGACDTPRAIVSGSSVRVVAPDGTLIANHETQWELRSAALLPDGDLVAVRYGYLGIARLDAAGRILWHREGMYHHQASVDGESVWTMLHHRGWTGASESVVRLDLATGDTLDTWGIDDLVGHGLRRGSRTDPWHPNRVVPLPDGGLLLSLREADTVLTVWPWSDRAPKVWARGTWDAQHAPSVVEGGGLLVFDNGNRRVVEVDAQGHVVWSHPVKSHAWGHTERTPCGTTLIADTVAGQVLEVDAEGRVVWDYRTDGPVMEATTQGAG